MGMWEEREREGSVRGGSQIALGADEGRGRGQVTEGAASVRGILIKRRVERMPGKKMKQYVGMAP